MTFFDSLFSNIGDPHAVHLVWAAFALLPIVVLGVFMIASRLAGPDKN